MRLRGKIIAGVVVLSVALGSIYFGFRSHRAPLPKVLVIHKSIVGNMMWCDGPDVVVNGANIAKLNGEMESLLRPEDPEWHYKFTVVPAGRRWVTYKVGGDDMPDALYKKLSDYAGKRVLKLAGQQAEDEKGSKPR